MFDINAREKNTRASLRQEGNLLDYLTTMGETQSLKNTLQNGETMGLKEQQEMGDNDHCQGNPRWMDSDDFFHKFIC